MRLGFQVCHYHHITLFCNVDVLMSFADLKGVDQMTFSFELGTPFRPFEQLMGVLPEASKDLIPLAFRVGFTNWIS